MAKDLSADGLRGVAALNVFFAHFLLAFFPLGFVHFFPTVAQPAASGGYSEKLLSTPVLSVLWSGRLPVCVFFVLSGYVLTKRFLTSGSIDGVRSMAARRYLRLGIPVFGSTMFAYALMATGAYQSMHTVNLTHSAWLTWQWWGNTGRFWDAVREGTYGAMLKGDVSYNPVFWTMRIELIGSLLILAYRMLAWPGPRGFVAALVYLALIVSLAPSEWPFYLAFLIGTHIGQIEAPRNRGVVYIAALLGLIIGGVDSSPMFAVLHAVPMDASVQDSFFSVVGGGLLVYAVRGGAFRQLLESRPIQFLGKISYPLYLIHLPILLSVGCGIFNWLMDGYGLSRVSSSAISILISLLVTLTVAYFFEILVDAPAIRLSKKFTELLGKDRNIAGATV